MLFTGRLTSDAEVKELKNNKKVTNFTVALNYQYKKKAGEKKEKTAFIECAYWVNPALAGYLNKGAIVEINGWVEADAYISAKDQTAKARLVCNVDSVRLFSPAPKPETNAPVKTVEMIDPVAAIDTTFMNGEDDDDQPF